MNEKITRQIEEMKKQTIGVEIEMNNIERSRAAKVAATYFGTGRYENTASCNGYYSWSAWDSQGREWKFQRDVSIAGPDRRDNTINGGHENKVRKQQGQGNQQEGAAGFGADLNERKLHLRDARRH